MQVIVMHYSIFESGTLIASYANEADAINALVSLAAADPGHAGALVFVAFNDEGQRVGAPVFGAYVCPE
jgi:hypothetical protein